MQRADLELRQAKQHVKERLFKSMQFLKKFFNSVDDKTICDKKSIGSPMGKADAEIKSFEDMMMLVRYQ